MVHRFRHKRSLALHNAYCLAVFILRDDAVLPDFTHRFRSHLDGNGNHRRQGAIVGLDVGRYVEVQPALAQWYYTDLLQA